MNSAVGPKNTLVCTFLRFWLGREQCREIQLKSQTLDCTLETCNPNIHLGGKRVFS